MANNCLVTKLKGVVDNNSLLKLGEMRVSVHIDDDFPHARPYLYTRTPIEVRILGGGVFTDTGLPVKTTSGSNAPYTIDPDTFPKGSYDIAFNKYGTINNLRMSTDPANGGMYLANHRGDALVFNIEDYQYSEILGLNLPYQQIYGDLHKLVEAGIDNVNVLRLSDNYTIQGSVTDMFMLMKGCMDGKYSGRTAGEAEIKLRSSLTGTLKEAMDALAVTAANGSFINMQGFEYLGYREVFPDFPNGNPARVTFNGSGGYTVSSLQ